MSLWHQVFRLWHESFNGQRIFHLYGWITVGRLSMHQLMDIWVVFTFTELFRRALPWTFVYKFYLDVYLHFLLGIYLRGESLSHMVTLFNVWKNHPSFSKVSAPFCVPTSHVWVSSGCSTSSSSLGIFCIFHFNPPKWYSTVVLSCVSLTINDVKPLCVILLVILHLLCEKSPWLFVFCVYWLFFFFPLNYLEETVSLGLSCGMHDL